MQTKSQNKSHENLNKENFQCVKDLKREHIRYRVEMSGKMYNLLYPYMLSYKYLLASRTATASA